LRSRRIGGRATELFVLVPLVDFVANDHNRHINDVPSDQENGFPEINTA